MGFLIGVVYGVQSKIVRRIVIPEDDTAMASSAAVLDGEALLTFQKGDDVKSPEDAKNKAWQLLGVDPTSVPTDRCAVIDPATELVTSIVSADPTLDQMQGFQLIADNAAEVNWKYSGGKFLPRYIVLDRRDPSATSATVTDVQWLDPATPWSMTLVINDTAQIGDTISIEPFVSTQASGTQVF